MNVSLEDAVTKVGNRRHLANLALGRHGIKQGRWENYTLDDENMAIAQDVELRCARVIHKLLGLQKKLEKNGDIAYVELPDPWKLDDLEAKLGIIVMPPDCPKGGDDSGRTDTGERK